MTRVLRVINYVFVLSVGAIRGACVQILIVYWQRIFVLEERFLLLPQVNIRLVECHPGL